MAVRAHVLYKNPHLGKALMFSAVGHSVALMMLLVSPRWFPVPDTSASTMDAIEVQLFSAIVSGAAPAEHVLPPATEVAEDVLPSAADQTRRAEAPKPKPKPASPPPATESATEKAVVSSVPPPPEPVQPAKAEISIEPPPESTVTTPKAQPDIVVPPKPEPIQAAKVTPAPVPDQKSPRVSVRQSVNTLLDSLKAGMHVPEPMVPAAPLPEAPKLAKLSDLPAVLPKTMPSPKTSERLQKTVQEALENVAVPAPLKRLVPIREAPKLAELGDVEERLPEAASSSAAKERVDAAVKDALKGVSIPLPLEPVASSREAPKLAKLAEIPDVLPEAVTSREAQERVRAVVKDTLKDLSIPSPVGPSVSPREAPKLAKLAEIPDVLPEAVTSREAQERVRAVVKDTLKDLSIPSPLEQPVPAPRKLAELPAGSAVVPPRESAEPARTKEQLHATVTKALEKVEIPSPMADSEPLDVASLPPSATPSPSVYSELKVIRERNDAMAEERVAEHQRASDANLSGSSSAMPEAARWEKAFAKYASRVKTVIDRNWHWQGNNQLELRVSVSFRISPDGRATRVVIAKTSGNQIFDRAAIRAVRQLKRLPRFPADIQRKFLDVEMEFSKVSAS